MLIWAILILVPMLFGFYAQMRVKSAYNKNVQIPSRGRVTGREAAAAVMQSAGIHDVEIVRVELPRPRDLDMMATDEFGVYTRKIRHLFDARGWVD